MESTSSHTGTTLFGLLAQPASGQAWTKFVDRYGPQILRWCRARGLQQADAENVTQEVLSRFAKVARTFAYDPAKSGFRAWLRTVTRNALNDLVKDTRKVRASGDHRLLEILESLEAARSLEQELDGEFRRELLEQAMGQVRLRVDPKTWQAFELLAIADKAGKEVAQQLQMSVAAVYMAKSRVVRMLEAETRRLE
jgi:RNA polymerase sigma factor (sigma-70 family)